MTDKKNYYNEKKVQELLVAYQAETIIENGKCIKRNIKVENELVKEVQKIVAAIIFTYQFQRFEPFEDLMQQGMLACAPNFLKFTPYKGSSYNYFSLITKKTLLNYTLRRQRHRKGVEFDKIKNVVKVTTMYDFSEFISSIEEDIFYVIDQNFLGAKRKRHVKTAALIIDYLHKTQTFVSKSDLYAWCRSFGVKQNIVREFIKDFSKFTGEFNIRESPTYVEQVAYEDE